MDERVLGDEPSEGTEGGRRFGIYREHRDSALKMRSVTRNVVLFATFVAAIIAFSIFYPLMQYTSKSNKNTALFGRTKNITNANEVKQDNDSPNCSTQIFSFGHNCSEPYSPSTEDDVDVLSTRTDITTPDVRRFDDNVLKNVEGESLELDTNLDDVKDFRFQRTGRSKWPVVSTPYPYYRNTPVLTTAGIEEIKLSSQEKNVFAIPYDLSSYKNQDTTTTRVNFTPPPYVFTPYPNFTGSYAQLSPYKEPQNNTNFIQVMEYLNKNVAFERNFQGERPKVDTRERNTVMKVSGTYVMPLDRRRPGEIILSSSSDNIEEARPFFNGHAYVSDPFTKYRPTNPSDVNRLIPVKSSLDIGPRFRKPVSFVPTTSVAVDIARPASYGDKDLKYRATGSHTVAIFHPPAVVSQKPTKLSTTSLEKPKETPLSVVLDIYPVTVDSETDSSDESSSPAVRERGRLNPKWKPKVTDRPKWRPHPHRRPTTPDDPNAKNRMIVHLNLFPNNRKPYSSIRRNRPESTTDLHTITLPSGQFGSRSASGNAELRELNNETSDVSIQPSNTSNEKAVFNSDQPEFSALERSTKEEEEATTISNGLQNTFNNKEDISEYDNNGSNPLTLNPAVESELNTEQSSSIEESVDALFQNKSAETNDRRTTEGVVIV